VAANDFEVPEKLKTLIFFFKLKRRINYLIPMPLQEK